MRTLQLTLVALALTLTLGLFSASLRAADEKKADATGTWKWSQAGRQGGNPREMTLKLKQDGEKLTGALTTPPFQQGGDPVTTEIADGKVKGNEISFTITREFNGTKRTSKYAGTVDGDTLKGKITRTNQNNEEVTTDFEAKRVKEEEKKAAK
jgi:hypothetical protein